jgi:hypothetical protein
VHFFLEIDFYTSLISILWHISSQHQLSENNISDGESNDFEISAMYHWAGSTENFPHHIVEFASTTTICPVH